MSNITIELPDERMQQLQMLAQDANASPKEWLPFSVVEWLEDVQKFRDAARFALNKSEELYRRLA